MPVERKYERDIDVMLAEEFSVNPQFADAFKARTRFNERTATFEDVWVSRSARSGESDVVVVYKCDNGERFALLIEDKLEANLQPDQAARYKMRAEAESARGEYQHYALVLCAPKFYLEHRNDLDGFDYQISIEEIADMLGSNGNDARAKYRADFFRSAANITTVNA
jgi:hypothetical protein